MNCFKQISNIKKLNNILNDMFGKNNYCFTGDTALMYYGNYAIYPDNISIMIKLSKNYKNVPFIGEYKRVQDIQLLYSTYICEGYLTLYVSFVITFDTTYVDDVPLYNVYNMINLHKEIEENKYEKSLRYNILQSYIDKLEYGVIESKFDDIDIDKFMFDNVTIIDNSKITDFMTPTKKVRFDMN